MISGPMPSPRATVMGTGFAIGAQLIIVAVSLDDGIRELAQRLRSKPRVTVVTGAGVSAASGIPTFRGPGGLWRNFRPEELATPEAFERDPRLVWEWYAWRRELVAKARPNRAHEVLATWSRRFEGKGFALVTQNVDGLHERAGTESVIGFHGSLWELRCWEGCASSPEPWRDETERFETLPPLCPTAAVSRGPGSCGSGRPSLSSSFERPRRLLSATCF